MCDVFFFLPLPIFCFWMLLIFFRVWEFFWIVLWGLERIELPVS